jgi:prepilin-type N-terminal cleavage/methylation domain-containing protein
MKYFNKFNTKQAFTLIELSIVLLIVGILITGVVTYSRLVKQMKLTTIKQITYSSPVAGIKGLSLWLETTLDNSLTGAVNPINPDENEKIISWNDINPQTSTRVIVSQSTDSLRPTLTTTGTLNELPGIKFDGTQYLSTIKANGGNIPLNAGDDSFTLITVFQTNVNSGVNQSVIEQNSTNSSQPSGARASLLLSSLATYGFCGEGVDYWSCQTYLPKTPYISAIIVNDSGLTKIYSNSTSSTCSSTINSNTLNISDAGFFIGVKGTSLVERMNGVIYEIIIFDRVINTEELNDTMRYLSKKYAIKLN